MTTINGHTFFPHQANWTFRLTWKLRRQTGVATAVDGTEQRAALRAQPLHTLNFMVTAATLPERCRIDARIDQASKSGLAAVPFFGRGASLTVAAAAGTNSLTLDSVTAPWAWAVGDYAVLLGGDDTVFDCWQVTNVAGNVLTLADNLVNTWPAALVRPLLFGKFSADKMAITSGYLASVKLTVAQLVSERNAQLGSVVPDTGTGVGHQKIGSTNVIG